MKIQKPKRRKAKFDATLVYMDEPLVMTLTAGKSRLIAVAVPPEGEEKFPFYATTVSIRDWGKYLSESVDLRYLFTFPDQRNAYLFDLENMKDGEVLMTPFLDETPEKYLPSPRFFAGNHTDEYAHDERPADVARLLVDGDWELSEFGHFNQRYADIYAFSVAVKKWSRPGTSLKLKQDLRRPFLDRPYQGGFSYVHLFNDLNDNIPVEEQLSLNKIQYASPGYVDMSGKSDVFVELQELVTNFLERRRDIVKLYNELWGYLHKNGYLRLSGDQYGRGDPSEKYISKKSEELHKALKMGSFAVIGELTNDNHLVSAKVILSFYRRLNELASFFAQGRVSFD
ncbi:hypothetical protein RLPCCGM1_c1238 [Rhizobium leguminosarum bv. phaseoli CCGM1]|uniref:hypothetical protein n=1 Tax=Rhizobium phaseoli TaxID=396 RepID=UPI0004D6805B|nr:hypothetical protein [Rhizobium phaseoli]KEC74894.1 hypothetical protein RLPCCGM1_c1238 [Rhizobium leguminosarum bv. phaseoli CCGM1]PWI54096.1 hypothetical protein B5K03_11660 [Rhizobium phaseoli]